MITPRHLPLAARGLAVALWLLVRTVHVPARWFTRRLTTAGAMVVAGLVACGAVSHPSQTVGLPALVILTAVLVHAMLWAPWFRPRLRVRRQVPRLAACGQPVQYPVTITNRTRRWQRGLMLGEAVGKSAPTLTQVQTWMRRGRTQGAACPPVEVPPLAPGASVTVQVTLLARQRGLLRLSQVLVSRADPLGLFRGFVALRQPSEVLVLPTRYPVPPLDLAGHGRHQAGGPALAAGIGAAEEFAALRDYRRGDPMRHIHWRSSARTGELVVQERHDDEMVRHALVLDPGFAGEDDRFEDAVAVAASFACTVPSQEVLLDLLFVGDRALMLSSGRGTGHAGPMLEALAGVTPQVGAWSQVANLVRQHQTQVAGCMLVLLALDGPRRALIRQLRAGGVQVLVLLVGDVTDEPAPEERPDRLVILRPGRVAEDLASMGSSA